MARKDDFGGVYVGKCLPTGKLIVGSSIKVKQRMAGHICLLRSDEHYNPYLQNAWNKYGEDNFTWDVLEHCSEEQQFIREQHWINTLRSHEEAFGFNIAFPVRQLLPSKRMSAIHKKLWAELTEEDLEWRLQLSRAALSIAHEQWNDPVRRAELAQKVFENVSKAHARWHSDPEFKATVTQQLLDMSAKASDLWENDPEFRAKHTARLAGQAKAASDAANKKIAEDPEYREQLFARLRKQSKEISERAKGRKKPTVAASAKARWDNPETRAQMTEAIRAGRRRALAEKQKGQPK